MTNQNGDVLTSEFPTGERGFSADEDMVDGDMVVGVDDTSGFPAAGGVDGARFAPPAEIEIVPLSRVDDITGEDRRNDLDSLPEVPDLGTLVGLVDASTDASTQAANVIVDEKIELDLDTFVVSAQRLTDGSVLFHYGLVTEVSGRVEGAEMATDTARLAAATLPGQRFRRAEVTWIRTHPERYLPPSSGAPIWAASDVHRRRALFLDKMAADEALPIGLDMNDQIVFLPYTFLNGDRGAHVSISGKSGVATKTSYALFLLYILFETDAGRQARGWSAHDRAVIFSVKGEDLMCIDQPNAKFLAGEGETAEAAGQWQTLIGSLRPGPFTQVAAYAPAEDAAAGREAVPQVSVRPRRDTHAYGWSPARFIEAGLLEFVFDDLQSGQLSFIEQIVRLELLRWAWPVSGDETGKVVLCDPDKMKDNLPATWDSAVSHWRSVKSQNPQVAGAGAVVSSLEGIVHFVVSKVTEDLPSYDPRWVGGVTRGTVQAFVRRLYKALPRLRRLVSAGLAEVDLAKQVSVVDVHALHADAQRFVVASVLSRVWDEHEDSTALGKTFVVLDELNKYAPRRGDSPIKDLLVDIAARGRSLGVILIGAQQSPSGVARDITNNASLEAVGQIKSSEASELGFLPPNMRARAQIIPPGTLITSQPLLPVPVPIRFPFPPFATRASEVAGSSFGDEAVDNILDRQ